MTRSAIFHTRGYQRHTAITRPIEPLNSFVDSAELEMATRVQHVQQPRRFVACDAISEQVHDILRGNARKIDVREVFLHESPKELVDAGILHLLRARFFAPLLDLADQVTSPAQTPL